MSVESVESFTPYTTAAATFSALPTWVNEYDAQRINAYQVYEQIYWNVPETFKLVLRGEENNPIYIPTGRTIVDTTNRYLCPSPAFLIDPDVGEDTDQETMRRFMSALFRRERFWSKFNSNKRYGIMRGDWCWHILANPAKTLGRRLTIQPIDPAAYFPVTHPDDPDRIIAAHIVEQYTDPEGTARIKRQTYQKGLDPVNNDGTDTTIYNSIAVFALEEWEALDASAVTTIKPPTALPPQITSIPIYHIKNIETPGDPFGSSELRGLERIMAAINQAISDEELTLALEGLGMYATDGGPPRDEQGNITDWVMGPGRVVEHAKGSRFERVTGVQSVDPVQNHLTFLLQAVKEASATPDAAISKIDVSVAESGISLLLQLGPMLSKVEEKSDAVDDVMIQMYYDLNRWIAAYEQLDLPCVALPVYGSPIPEDRDKRFKEVMEIVAAGLADAEWARAELGKIGFEFPDDTGDAVLTEAAARARATDPFAVRMQSEMEEEETA